MRALIAFALLFVPFLVSAQIIPILEVPLEVRMVPEAPQPGGQVLFEVVGTPKDAQVSYEWRIDGALYDQGRGRNRITVTAGNTGEATVVSVSVYVNGSLYGEKEKVIRPANITLVWEGDTYTPPFYEGLPLPNKESRVRLLAVPDVIRGGVRISSSSLNYEWFINNSRTSIAKGVGLDNIDIKVPGLGDSFSVTVSVKTLDGLIETYGTTLINPVNPQMLIYEKTPLLGLLLNKAINDTYALEENEVVFTALPLNSSPVSQLDFSWKVNGDIAETGRSPQELVLRKTGEGAGEFRILINTKNPLTLFERFSADFLLTF